MNWEAIGAVGEVVGALGVVTTLAYLATQVRTSQTWQRRQGFREGLGQLLDSVARIGDHAPLYQQGCLDFAGLDPSEQLEFHSVIGPKYASIELFYDYHASGETKPEAIERLNGWILDDFRYAGVRQWWDAVGRDTYSRDFGREVDALIEDSLNEPPSTTFELKAGY